MMQAVKPKWTESSLYKLYVCPVTTFDATSLKEVLSQYAQVTDLYMSEPKENGYRWAFVYYDTEKGLEDTIRGFEENNVYNFKMSRAKPKTFPPQVAVPPNTSFGTKMMNGIAKTNGVSYTAPPNCVHCRKLTFQQCVSCKNPFCSKECTLDGWRSHTSSCVKVAELIKVSSDSNGVQGNALTATVINYMKDCKSSKKKFTSDEFADACNYRGLVTVSPSTPKEEPTETEFDNLPVPNKHHDKGRRSAAPLLPKPPQPISDNEEDHWASSIEKHPAKTPFQKHIKRNVAPPRKSNRKYSTDNENVEENIDERPFSDSQPKKYHHCTDNEEFVVRNGHRSDERRAEFKKKLPNEFKRPVKSKETRINARVPDVDLKLKPGDSLPVMVASIADANTFYVADSGKMLQVLTEIHDFTEVSPGLKKVETDERCLAYFDGDWYRARILTTSPIQVEYIDYGNKDFCNIEDLKELPSSLQKYLPLASKVQLKDGDVSQHNIKENEEIEIYVDKFNPESNTWIIDVL